MGKHKNLDGQIFGKWTVKAFSRIDKNNCAKYICECECGTIKEVYGKHLKDKTSQSCGCGENKGNKKHGYGRRQDQNPTYRCWCGIIGRCLNPKHPFYARYGGRGIRICERWLKFENFLKDMGEKPKGLTIERKNNDGDYCLDNCVWDTRKQQARNRSSNAILTFNGESHCLSEWSEILGWKKHILSQRRRRGWSDERILTTPVRKRRSK